MKKLAIISLFVLAACPTKKPAAPGSGSGSGSAIVPSDAAPSAKPPTPAIDASQIIKAAGSAAGSGSAAK